MEFGLITGGSVDRVTEDIGVAERGPFGFVGLADSQFLTNELYTTLGAVAGETETVRLGPTMTNPVTRHPAVHASALCTLQELTDGRMFLGLASGDSAVYTLGKTPADRERLESAARTVRRLSRGETVGFDGSEMQLEWLSPDREYTIPIAMAAEGPKTLQMAGRVADQVVIGLGRTEAVVTAATERIDAGAEAAGRDPDDIRRYLYVDTNVRDDRERAVDEMKHSLAASAHHSLQFTLEGKAVPPELTDDIKQLVRGYDSTVHGQPAEDPNRQLVEELGLRDYLAERYAIAGTPADCREQLRTLAGMEAVDGVLFAVHTGRNYAVLQRLADEVLPAV